MLKAGSYTLASALIALGWQKRRVIAQLVSALLNIGINLVIINKYGIIGVAWVYVLSETVLLFGYFLLFLRRKTFQEQFANA
jgi:O-antigen/teichoic acid export membrane protein